MRFASALRIIWAAGFLCGCEKGPSPPRGEHAPTGVGVSAPVTPALPLETATLVLQAVQEEYTPIEIKSLGLDPAQMPLFITALLRQLQRKEVAPAADFYLETRWALDTMYQAFLHEVTSGRSLAPEVQFALLRYYKSLAVLIHLKKSPLPLPQKVFKLACTFTNRSLLNFLSVFKEQPPVQEPKELASYAQKIIVQSLLKATSEHPKIVEDLMDVLPTRMTARAVSPLRPQSVAFVFVVTAFHAIALPLLSSFLDPPFFEVLTEGSLLSTSVRTLSLALPAGLGLGTGLESLDFGRPASNSSFALELARKSLNLCRENLQ